MSSSNQNTTQTTTKENGKEENTKKVLRPCCVCKETRMVIILNNWKNWKKEFLKVRDECIILNGEESCGALIEAHKKCLKEYGFEMWKF